MINILKQGSSLLITSDNSQFPWKDGKMSVPLNSIAYIIDESDYVTFRSVANNDILFTSLIGELKINDESVSKDDLITMFDSVANSSGSGGGTASAGVNSINGYQGDINIKTVNGTSLIGSGDITIEGGSSAEETDPIFTDWKNADNVIVGNGAKYDIDGADAEQIQPSIIIGKGASVWASGIAIGENAYSESSAVTIGKNITSYGILSIGSDNEGGGIAIGKNNKGDGIIIGENNNSNGITIGSGVTENYGIAIGENVSNPTDNGIAIGRNAKVNEQYPEDTDNGYGIAIGCASIAYYKDDVAIGSNVMTDLTYKTNFNNVLKGDVNKYAFVLNEYGNYVRIPTEWTGTQSQYDDLGTYYDNITYNIIED